MGRLRRGFGRDDGETAEHHVRRLGVGRLGGGHAAPVVPSVIELYDRVARLESRVAEFEGASRSTWSAPGRWAPARRADSDRAD